MGTVPTHDALVTGGLEVHGDTARLLTNTSVTAYDHSAAISLARGGEVLVCATSQFHLLHSGTENSLLFGLDRGAIELHTDSSPQDVILTPDIRFTLEHPGHYDLRLRVTPNGDTCVENSGSNAPVLSLADPFSGATYRLIPGQHVLFEHGSLHEVVDNERSPCGCPTAPPPPVQQIAATPNATPSQPTPPDVAAAEHPFPAAASQGLAPPAPPPTNATACRRKAHPGLHCLHLRRRPPQHTAAQHRRTAQARIRSDSVCGLPHRHRHRQLHLRRATTHPTRPPRPLPLHRPPLPQDLPSPQRSDSLGQD